MPDNVTRKAAWILARYLSGEIQPRRCPRYKSEYLVFNVNGCYRLLCLSPINAQDPNAWTLCKHPEYERLIAKKPEGAARGRYGLHK